MVTIAVDAMGGDYAPKNEVEGAVMALKESGNRFKIVLVGQSEKVQPLLDEQDTTGLSLEFFHAPEVIGMHESAATAVKTKQNSSMVQGLALCKKGSANAFVSAGNTGAQMAASLLVLGRLEKVMRPTIGAYFPNPSGVTMVFDIGANVDCKPEHLVQFAEMASIYLKYAQKEANPSVGLLNIGAEESKGTDALKQTHKLLRGAHEKGKVNFAGNIEGGDVLAGKTNIVLCDGVVGNPLLKFGESIPHFLSGLFKQEIGKLVKTGKLPMESAEVIGKAFKGMFASFDDEQFGGVPLLGVNGVSIIGHGRSSALAIKNMIYRAEEMIEKRVNEHIAEVLADA
ncbi:fatty acid/phospholipid synthesis protein PlsX [Chloroherpeton thalassium ATCC 35110]|uniref:Phosphate acyltransferase n=1 Tax=Chloroherpeton thalassium (strain ATCC 35110 / GB-78) TaxID=517418 RepID=B3QTV4_CHLT3|nr:phosphate acyltransferase PlsX [Chloroherpeton thalassium]ACF14302.1 fatty acid/phospholipid synthesis protein PlsX [Chloroherpeton thalassium ATCC 35110]